MAERRIFRRCDACEFYLVGECHRYPPQIITDDPLHPYWPTVSRDEWCGEFRFKETI